MAPEYLQVGGCGGHARVDADLRGQRILSYNQMDFQYACSQMVSLCRSPSAVYVPGSLLRIDDGSVDDVPYC